ncbi:hypothetical protein DPMN_101064 [Dreissena polymorpha]|uniref:Uncharacterized protein n=1 Tax=Dreissena polymorpha TaxID=45954 RepID=A0A9D4LI84_DREPO|nr:hypothetical protein DPMN_101064 [Dreissena polymorpha]
MVSTTVAVKKIYLSSSHVGESHIVGFTNLRTKVNIEAGYVIVVSVVFVVESAVIASLFRLLNQCVSVSDLRTEVLYCLDYMDADAYRVAYQL